MTREAAVTVMILIALAIIALAVWGWLRRTRRDAELDAPTAPAPSDATVVAPFTGLYVATTRHGEPLERLAVRGLGFRARADLVVTDAGVVLDITGQDRVFVPADQLVGVAQATVAIDRVVEPDGLVRLEWRLDDTVVDSYFRPQETSARFVVDTISDLITATPTGTDA